MTKAPTKPRPITAAVAYQRRGYPPLLTVSAVEPSEGTRVPEGGMVRVGRAEARRAR